MAMASFSSKAVILTRESSSRDSVLDEASSCGKMVRDTPESFSKTSDMEKAGSITSREVTTKVSGVGTGGVGVAKI